MTQEQEFKEIVRAAHKERGTILTSEQIDPFNYDIMKAAHNAAVRKCAETAEPHIETVAGQCVNAEVDKDSILKNLIP